MADRYWVGGAGSWNSTTKWSTTSGGASGASVPTSADNAIFNANSGSGAVHYTVTVTDNATCANLTFTPVAADGVTEFSLGTGFVIAGTFSTSGTVGNRRAWFRSSTYGLMRDMQIATIGTVTDVDFRDVRVTGAGGVLSGTRIGDLRGNLNITFSTAKIVYWNLAGAQNWSANAWATTSAGTPSTDNFPLAQDTATFTNAGSVTGTITMNAAVPYTGTVDMSGRTSAMTLATTAFTINGNWTNGSGTTLSGTDALTYSGRNTQTITSSGKTFTQALTVDSYGGSVELADALNIGTTSLTVTNGTFDTKNYNVTAGDILSSNSNVRAITLGSSTVTLSSQLTLTTSTNLTFNAGTSSIVNTPSSPTFDGGSQTFYSVSFTSTSTATGVVINGANTFQNLSFSAPATAGRSRSNFSANQTITGTLTCAGASAVRRIILISDTVGTPRTLTVATLSADDCDFRDITIAGAAAGSSPTRAGNCGGNTGITFPVAKTVYWNLAGAQNWSATAWATSSGGTPAVNNFPLAQDTAVYDNTGSVTGTITIDAGWNIGTFDASARTSAMTLTTSTNTPTVYGNWLFGTGITQTSTTGTITFAGQTTQTITSNGVTFGCPVTINSSTGTVQLADALTLISTRTLTLTSGTFDAVTYNVTIGLFSSTATTATLKMGAGTWTLSGTGSVWGMATTGLTLYKGTANIVLSDTSTTARTFTANTYSYNKLTIGGATGTSTLTITGTCQFTELASTKTVAHTISLGTNTVTFGAWTVTGTVGNVVTVTGTGVSNVIAGARVSGVDYLAMGTIGFIATSPGEFYAGVNSTGTGTGVILTAAPSATTRYWVGGTGTWDATTTTNWATSSGGVSGASVPTSADAVIFDTLSNATGYTVTCTATQLRCAALTFAGPLSGSVTWAGTAPLAIHGNFSLPATVLTRTYTGAITFSGSSTGRTITTNGNALASATTIDGVGCGWTLADAFSIGTATLTATNGSFATSSYTLTTGLISSNNLNSRTINFGSSTIAGSGSFLLGTTENARASLTFAAGTSQINLSTASPNIQGNNQTFYNVSTTSATLNVPTITGANTFNNLSFAGRTTAGIANISISDNQTINGTLTLSAGTDATMRNFVRSDTIGTTRTLTCAAFAGTDADFRDITIAGAAAPVSGTRLGDAKGNSGITFGAGATKYWNLAAGGNWGGAIGWATSSGGSPAINNFPLAQDTCLFEATGLTSGSTVTVNAGYNIGTINMSARTSNLMTLATGTTTPFIYGNWINGTGTTLTGTGLITFSGRGSQTITSAAVAFTQRFTINTLGGSVTLQDAFSSSAASDHTITGGTFDANNYNFTLTNATGTVNSSGSTTRTVAVGSGTWTIAGSGQAWDALTATNLTVTGTGTISLTSASTKNFRGGGISYSGITVNQGGAGALTITGNNTFANISNTYKATGAATINMGTTTQTVGSFTASGEVGRVLTVQGTSSTSPCTLIYTGATKPTTATTDYLTLTGVRAYSLLDTWYAGANSTNNGSLGWIFSATPAAGGGNKFFLMFG